MNRREFHCSARSAALVAFMITEQRQPAGLSDAPYLAHLNEKLDAIVTV